jgi:hypothetical protein
VANNSEDKRPSVAEIRRMFDPVLAINDSPPSRCKEVTTVTKDSTSKPDSDDESESSSESEEEESSEDEVTVTSAAVTLTDKSPTRRARAAGLPAGSSEDITDRKEVGCTLFIVW